MPNPLHNQVVLVDASDNAIGTMEKMEAHRQARLHRAFSVFIFNTAGKMLLQQRAFSKYHSGGLWTNACCSHPFPDEPVATAATRRLQEELGFTVALKPTFEFVYQAAFDNGLTEYEYDHVFTGVYDGPISPNPAEVAATTLRTIDDIEESLRSDPQIYTAWFRLAFPRIIEWKKSALTCSG